jgi:hypothetical protein
MQDPTVAEAQPTGRRQVLVGLAASALLAACGGRSASTSAATSAPATTTGSSASAGWRLGARFADGYVAPSTLVAGSAQRAPYVLLGSDGWPMGTEGPDHLDLTVRRAGANGLADGPVVATHTVERHGGDHATPYFPLVFRVDDPGDYVVQVATGTTGDVGIEPHHLRVVGRGETTLIQVGDRLPAVATPTRTDPAGVDPICTEPNGPCSFHEISVAEALGQTGPVALLVSTPRFCQSDVCGPTVGLLRSALRVQSEPWSAVHAEVYMAPEAGDFTTTPTVAALGLAFEPSLVVADVNGIVTAALHFTMDATEVANALATAV